MKKKSGKFQKNQSEMTPAKWKMVTLAIVAVVVLVILITLIVRVNRVSEEVEQTTSTEMTTVSEEVFVPTTDSMEIPVTQASKETEVEIEETTAPETEPLVTETEETKPAETKPQETETQETKPQETKPQETTPKETKPAQTKPAETKPQEVKPEAPVPEATQPQETEPRKPRPVEEKIPKETIPKATEPPQTEPKPTEEPSFVPVTEPEEKAIEFPYMIPNTTLKVHRIAPYDGIYLEDGKNTDKTGIAMILLENTGSEAIEYADITMVYGDVSISFKMTALPAGAKGIVQTVDSAAVPSGKPTACYATVATLPSLTLSEEQVSWEDNGNNTLNVTNLTDKEIPMIRVFYKYYMEEDAIFVGGITYTAKITNLAAGESVTINPSHYASEGGKIVMIRTYDTVE